MPGKKSPKKNRKRELSIASFKSPNFVRRTSAKFKWTLNMERDSDEIKKALSQPESGDELGKGESLGGIFDFIFKLNFIIEYFLFHSCGLFQ